MNQIERHNSNLDSYIEGRLTTEIADYDIVINIARSNYRIRNIFNHVNILIKFGYFNLI